MLKHKTSVLFVNSKGKDNRVVQVPTNVILHWRKILLVFAVIILSLMGVLSIFVYHATSEEYKMKLVEANRIKSLINIEKAKQSFQSIDESMSRINTFLSMRGLKELELENVGGGVFDFEVTDIDEVSNFYENQVKSLEDIVRETPIGKPLEGEITSKFGYRKNPFHKKTVVVIGRGGKRRRVVRGVQKHSGLDFRGKMGASVRTTAEGVVEFAGRKGGYGNCIIINHPNKFKTLYAHLSKINVEVNQKVIVGQVIGNVGSTGRSTGPHLHYEIISNNQKINPEPYLVL